MRKKVRPWVWRAGKSEIFIFILYSSSLHFLLTYFSAQLVLDAAARYFSVPWEHNHTLHHQHPQHNNLQGGLKHSCYGLHLINSLVELTVGKHLSCAGDPLLFQENYEIQQRG